MPLTARRGGGECFQGARPHADPQCPPGTRESLRWCPREALSGSAGIATWVHLAAARPSLHMPPQQLPDRPRPGRVGADVPKGGICPPRGCRGRAPGVGRSSVIMSVPSGSVSVMSDCDLCLWASSVACRAWGPQEEPGASRGTWPMTKNCRKTAFRRCFHGHRSEASPPRPANLQRRRGRLPATSEGARARRGQGTVGGHVA